MRAGIRANSARAQSRTARSLRRPSRVALRASFVLSQATTAVRYRRTKPYSTPRRCRQRGPHNTTTTTRTRRHMKAAHVPPTDAHIQRFQCCSQRNRHLSSWDPADPLNRETSPALRLMNLCRLRTNRYNLVCASARARMHMEIRARARRPRLVRGS